MEELSRDVAGQTIGVDLGDKWSRFCVLDDQGEVCEEGRIATTSRAMLKRFGTLTRCRIVIAHLGVRSNNATSMAASGISKMMDVAMLVLTSLDLCR